MPTRPNVLERLLLFRLNRGPAPMLDLFGTGSVHAVALAVDLELFEAMGSARTVRELADELALHPEGLHPLLRFLESQGYVASNEEGYRRTAMTEQWLTDDGDANLGPWFVFWRDVVLPFWDEQLETTVRDGEPLQTLYAWLDDHPDLWPTTQRGFRAAATVLVDPVTDALDVPDQATRLLDLGGGHGLYAAALCERYPDLSAVVFDDPAALGVASEEVEARGLSDRVMPRGGDYLVDDLGGPYDVVLLFNVLHAHDGSAVRTLFERVHDALAPGGRIAILDQFEGSGSTPVGRSGVAFVGLTYQVTLGETVHDADEVAAWLREAGFAGLERTPIRRAGPGNVLVQARRA